MAGYIPPAASGFASGRLGRELDASPFSATNASKLSIDLSGSDADQFRLLPVSVSGTGSVNEMTFNGVTSGYGWMAQGSRNDAEASISGLALSKRAEIKLREGQRAGNPAILADAGNTEPGDATFGYLEGETSLNTVTLTGSNNDHDITVRVFELNL